MTYPPPLPAGWNYVPIKRAARLRFSSVDKHSLPDEEPTRLCNYVDVYRNEHITSALNFMPATATPSEIARFSLATGDVLLTKDSETPDDIGVPACVTEPLPGVICGYHLAMLRPGPGLDGRFLHRALQAHGIRDQLHAAANGVTRFAIGLGDVGGALIPLPPLDTQRAIADFLDRRTAAIDALIEKKERLISAIEGRLQAITSEAVTGGHTRSVALAPTNVPQLPDRAPVGWRVAMLKRALRRIEQGWSPDCLSRPAEEGEWGVLKTGAVNSGTLDVSESKALPPYLPAAPEYEVHRGDLLMARASGSPKHIGAVGLVETDRSRLLLCDKLYRLIPRTDWLDPRFARWALRAPYIRSQIGLAATGQSTLQNIGQDDVGALWFLFPPIAEQRAIASHLDMESRTVAAQTALLTRQLAGLSEYRHALITAAVTGQHRVTREAA